MTEFLRLEPAPTTEPIVVDYQGNRRLNIFTAWLPWLSKLFDIITLLSPSVGQDVGDANTTLTVGTSAWTQIYDTPITTGRTVTLSTTKAHNGAKFRVVRTAAATGASNVSVGGLKNLAAGQWCDVEMSEDGWILTGFGSL